MADKRLRCPGELAVLALSLLIPTAIQVSSEG